MAERCPICDWTLQQNAESGCTLGSCSFRPGACDPATKQLRERRALLKSSVHHSTRLVCHPYGSKRTTSWAFVTCPLCLASITEDSKERPTTPFLEPPSREQLERALTELQEIVDVAEKVRNFSGDDAYKRLIPLLRRALKL
ncbi:hypothetical protein KW797_00115 [Candidatus Parcubacteria bacterium]|nr:hypothetical protein [Candidatus Parcubacteria bacterium]